MKKILRCCFAGHSHIYDNTIKDKIKEVAEKLIINFNVKEFWIGNYGEFDRCAKAAMKELQSHYSDIRINLVIPYLTKDIIVANRDFLSKSFNQLIIAEYAPSTPKKFQIIKSNRYMIDHSDFLICYIEHSWGGAFQTFEYAKKKKIHIINIETTKKSNTQND